MLIRTSLESQHYTIDETVSREGVSMRATVLIIVGQGIAQSGAMKHNSN
jgi:hypothetical protein